MSYASILFECNNNICFYFLFQEVEVSKGSRFGYGSLRDRVDLNNPSSDTSNPVLEEQLEISQLKMKEMEKLQANQAKEVEYLKNIILKQFPTLATPPTE